jgi:hypothetical protein
MSKQLVLAFFESEAAADAAVTEVKAWDRASNDVKLGAIGVLVKDEKGIIKTHKVGARKTAGGAVLFGLAGLLSGGATLLGGLAAGGILGSFFHKGLGLSKDDVARLDEALTDGKAAVGLLVEPAQVQPVSGLLTALGGMPEAHEIMPEVVEQAAAATEEVVSAGEDMPRQDP